MPKRYLYSYEGLLALKDSPLCSTPEFAYTVDPKKTGNYGQRHHNGRHMRNQGSEDFGHFGPARGTFQSSTYRPKQSNNDPYNSNNSSTSSLQSTGRRDKAAFGQNNRSKQRRDDAPEWDDVQAAQSGSAKMPKSAAESIAEFEEWKAKQKGITGNSSQPAAAPVAPRAPPASTPKAALETSRPAMAKKPSAVDERWANTSTSFFDVGSSSSPSPLMPPLTKNASSGSGSSRFSKFFKGGAPEASSPSPELAKAIPAERPPAAASPGNDIKRLLNLLDNSAVDAKSTPAQPSPHAPPQAVPVPGNGSSSSIPPAAVNASQLNAPMNLFSKAEPSGNDLFFESLLSKSTMPPNAGGPSSGPPTGGARSTSGSIIQNSGIPGGPGRPDGFPFGTPPAQPNVPFPPYGHPQGHPQGPPSHSFGGPPPFGFPGVPEWTGNSSPYAMPPPGMMLPNATSASSAGGATGGSMMGAPPGFSAKGDRKN